MHKPLLTLLCSIALSATWLPAAAQVTPMPSPGTGTTTPVTTTPTTTTPAKPAKPMPVQAPTAGQPSFEQLMSSLNRMKAEVAQVQALRSPLSTNNVKIVKVQTIAGTDTAALNNALSKNASQLAALRNALSRVPLTAGTDNHPLTFAQFLADNKLSINQVVAADVANGALTAYLQ